MKQLFNKALIVISLCIISQITFAQNDVASTLKLTAPYDQLKFEVPGEYRYWIMSKTGGTNNRAFSLYSPDDGGFFTTWMGGTGNMILHKGAIGLGVSSPEAKFHLLGAESGTNTQYSSFIIEDVDAQMDLISNSAGSWGSSLNLIEGNGTTNSDIWSIARETTAGNGNSSLRFNYGTSNHQDNPTKVTFNKEGKVGIGTTTPEQMLSIYNSNGFNSNMEAQSQDHISLKSVVHGKDTYFGGITWKVGSRRRASVAAVQEETDSDHIGLAFFTQGTDGAGPTYESMRLSHNGNLGIGTMIPDQRLTVDGNIHATGFLRSTEVVVEASASQIPDYVFKPDYNLMSLEEVEAYVKANSHLPEVPSAEEVEANGHKLAEMNLLLLKKIEELTLYLLKEKNRNDKVEEDNVRLTNRVQLMETRLLEIEDRLKEN